MICQLCGKYTNPEMAPLIKRSIGADEPEVPDVCQCVSHVLEMPDCNWVYDLIGESRHDVRDVVRGAHVRPVVGMGEVVAEAEMRLSGIMAYNAHHGFVRGILDEDGTLDISDIDERYVVIAPQDTNLPAEILEGMRNIRLRMRKRKLPDATHGACEKHGTRDAKMMPDYMVPTTFAPGLVLHVARECQVVDEVADSYLDKGYSRSYTQKKMNLRISESMWQICTRKMIGIDEPDAQCRAELELLDPPGEDVDIHAAIEWLCRLGAIPPRLSHADPGFFSCQMMDAAKSSNLITMNTRLEDVPSRLPVLPKADGIACVLMRAGNIVYAVSASDCDRVLSYHPIEGFGDEPPSDQEIMLCEMLYDGRIVPIRPWSEEACVMVAPWITQLPVSFREPVVDRANPPVSCALMPSDGLVVNEEAYSLRIKECNVDLVFKDIDGKKGFFSTSYDDSGAIVFDMVAASDGDFELNSVYEFLIDKGESSGIKLTMTRRRPDKIRCNPTHVVDKTIEFFTSKKSQDPQCSLILRTTSRSLRRRIIRHVTAGVGRKWLISMGCGSLTFEMSVLRQGWRILGIDPAAEERFIKGKGYNYVFFPDASSFLSQLAGGSLNVFDAVPQARVFLVRSTIQEINKSGYLYHGRFISATFISLFSGTYFQQELVTLMNLKRNLMLAILSHPNMDVAHGNPVTFGDVSFLRNDHGGISTLVGDRVFEEPYLNPGGSLAQRLQMLDSSHRGDDEVSDVLRLLKAYGL